MRDGALRNFVAHLRVPFQLMLAPFVLLGAVGMGTGPELAWLLPFLIVHVGLYGGATVFNSVHDRDRGPIGLMKSPRPLAPGSAGAALGLQAVAVLWLGALHAIAGLIGGVMMAMGVAYSHPRVRWKARPALGLVAVAVGQGALAVYLGYFALGGLGVPPAVTHVSAACAALVAAGLYPITQLYQIDEDRERGDVTLPVRVGWRRALLFSVGVTALGLWGLAYGLGEHLSGPARGALGLAPLGLASFAVFWAGRPGRQTPERGHDWAMGVGIVASLGFWVVLAGVLTSGDVGPHVARAEQPGAFDDVPDRPAPVVHIERQGDAVAILARLDVPFTAGDVWPVVLDYDGLAAFMPNVDSSRVVERADRVVRVRQVGGVRVIFKRTYRFELEFARRNAERVDFRQVAGDLEGYTGSWSVLPRGASGDSSRIVYSGRLARGLGAPWFLARGVLYRNVRKMMPAIREELERRDDS